MNEMLQAVQVRENLKQIDERQVAEVVPKEDQSRRQVAEVALPNSKQAVQLAKLPDPEDQRAVWEEVMTAEEPVTAKLVAAAVESPCAAVASNGNGGDTSQLTTAVVSASRSGGQGVGLFVHQLRELARALRAEHQVTVEGLLADVAHPIAEHRPAHGAALVAPLGEPLP